jgi:hypothetical protein
MAIDQDLLFASNVAITGDALVGDVVDLVTKYVRPGVGPRPLYIDGRVSAAFTDTGNNSTATLYLQTSPYAAINSVTTNTAIGTIATNAAIGDRIGPFTIPPLTTTDRYMGIYAVTAGGNFSTGSVTIWATPDIDARVDFPVGWTGPSTS